MGEDFDEEKEPDQKRRKIEIDDNNLDVIQKIYRDIRSDEHTLEVYVHDKFPIGAQYNKNAKLKSNKNMHYHKYNPLVLLDLNRTIKENLFGREIGEFPRFYITTSK